ncbi:Chromobox protein-like protein 1 [Microtus ochrogaster]|uniref:Chromobox protein-like protein 1 n=1 Tax=Microtus ochrogaster TaxID=79684 RepID=A0A8J6GPL2_MICOH|nr:Chromobox protein-like protein 1 [Microtus ochrogaster]
MLLTTWTNTHEADMLPAKEANVKCPPDCHTFSEDKLMRYSYPSGDDVKKDDKNYLSWSPGPATSACGVFYSASRCLETAFQELA